MTEQDQAGGTLPSAPPAARRTWIGEALAAFDQGLSAAGEDAGFPEPEFWLRRAEIAASIEQAMQARIANLIAWTTLQLTRSQASEGQGELLDDVVVRQIEEGLGI